VTKPLHGVLGCWTLREERVHFPLVSEAVSSASTASEFLDILALQPSWMGHDKVDAAIEFFRLQAPNQSEVLRIRAILGSKYELFTNKMFDLSTTEIV